MTFLVKHEQFEGPLDLLLSLIEKHKLSISQVSLSKVADDFIAYIGGFQNFPIKESADFILVASTLVFIKSKTLLPTLELSEEESGSMEELEQRLKLYQKAKESAKGIRAMFGRDRMYFASDRLFTPVFSPHKVTIEALNGCAYTVISSMPRFEKIARTVVQKVVSLEEMIKSLSERISKSLKMSFRDFSGMGKKEKVHVIVSFLAMLELVKQGAIRVIQDRHFTDIAIETDRELNTPNYS